jgi:hypothetical protein
MKEMAFCELNFVPDTLHDIDSSITNGNKQ